MNNIKAIKGTYDILPGDVEMWQKIEEKVRKWMRIYNFTEIRTPVFEETGLFARSIGEDTDIVGKEMFTFKDMGDRSLTLRPEGTASVVRAFIEHSLDQRGLPLRFWYMGPMFRQERPQKGRQRQFHQFGVEIIGTGSALADLDAITLFDNIADGLGLNNRVFSINSLGGNESKQAYIKALVSFLDTIEERLCEDCKRRKSSNPLRVLDCKVPECHSAVHESKHLPKSTDHLTLKDARHYEMVKEYLCSYQIEFIEDPFLVRGLDYYTGTVFEMNYPGLGAQSAIVGGGRYDTLIHDLGGHDLPAVGFACGIERLILAMEAAGAVSSGQVSLDIYVVNTDHSVRSTKRALEYVKTIRCLQFSADMDHLERSIKAQMKAASKLSARFAVIIEPERDMVSVRDMIKSEQETMKFDTFLNMLKKYNMMK